MLELLVRATMLCQSYKLKAVQVSILYTPGAAKAGGDFLGKLSQSPTASARDMAQELELPLLPVWWVLLQITELYTVARSF